jgi:hypothetical protein
MHPAGIKVVFGMHFTGMRWESICMPRKLKVWFKPFTGKMGRFFGFTRKKLSLLKIFTGEIKNTDSSPVIEIHSIYIMGKYF